MMCICTHILGEYVNKRAKEVCKNVNNEEYKLLNANYIIRHPQMNIKTQIGMKKYRTHPDPWNTGYNSVDNFILAQYSKSQLVKMIEQKNIKYDYIIYLRPDVKYIEKIPVNFFKHVTDKQICIPNFHLCTKYKFNDRFCISNMNTYKIYGNVFEKLLEISKNRSLHSETVLARIMLDNKLTIIRIPFKFSRIRCDGTDKDKFKISTPENQQKEQSKKTIHSHKDLQKKKDLQQQKENLIKQLQRKKEQLQRQQTKQQTTQQKNRKK